MKMKKVKQFDNKCLWIINCLLDKINIFIPKNKKIWIFGSWLGKQYSDNSKYMYEYILEYKSDIKAYWVTSDIKIYNQLLKQDKPVLYTKTFKCFFIQVIAGVVFYTNSLYDLGNIHFFSRAYKVSLWHGVPLKKLYLDDNKIKDRKGIIKLISQLKKYLYNDTKRNLTIATSKNCANSFKTCFNLKYKDIVITGQPRNDILILDDIKSNKVKDKLKFNIKNKTICLYMPTYRRNKELAENLNINIENLINSKIFNEFLNDNNILFLIKKHSLVENTDFNKDGNIKYINNIDIDVQELLLISDILITDYSSCFIDFLIKKQPIIFWGFDYKEYDEKENGFYYNYKEMVGNLNAYTEKDIIFLLEKSLSEKKYFNNSIEKLNDIFNEKNNGIRFSENVYRELNSRGF